MPVIYAVRRHRLRRLFCRLRLHRWRVYRRRVLIETEGREDRFFVKCSICGSLACSDRVRSCLLAGWLSGDLDAFDAKLRELGA